MINLMNLPAAEAERLAYAEGFTGTAELFAKIADLERLQTQALDLVENVQDLICQINQFVDDLEEDGNANMEYIDTRDLDRQVESVERSVSQLENLLP